MAPTTPATPVHFPCPADESTDPDTVQIHAGLFANPDAAFGSGVDHSMLDSTRDLDGDGRVDRVGSVSETYVVQFHTATGWNSQCLGSESGSDRHAKGLSVIPAGAATYLIAYDDVDYEDPPAEIEIYQSSTVYRARPGGVVEEVDRFTLIATDDDRPSVVGGADESLTVSLGATGQSQRLRWDPANFRLVP